MTLSLKGWIVTPTVIGTQYNVMLSVAFSVVMLSGMVPSVLMLSVVAQARWL